MIDILNNRFGPQFTAAFGVLACVLVWYLFQVFDWHLPKWIVTVARKVFESDQNQCPECSARIGRNWRKCEKCLRFEIDRQTYSM